MVSGMSDSVRPAKVWLERSLTSSSPHGSFDHLVGACEHSCRQLEPERREVITLIGAAAAWPLAARGQQPGRMRRIGVMIALPESDPELKKWLPFRQGLNKLGWSEGRNVRLDYRFAPAGARADELAQELLTLQPDVILSFSHPATAAFQRTTRTIPIVFIGIGDAISQGFVRSLSQPEGNLTGLTMFEASVAGKWLGMLKEIQPQIARAAFVANPKTAPYHDFYMRGAKVVAPELGIQAVFTPIENDVADIQRVIAAFAQGGPNGGLVVLGDSTTNAHRNLIVSLAAQHRLPAVYFHRFIVMAGGLMSYGVDWVHEFGQVAYYVDRILRGAKPADLPVQAATKFETILNIKTAKALGLTVPPGLLVAADEVVE
jgi:putative ABC transport system substrate-binding protein